MGADIDWQVEGDDGEPIGRVVARYSPGLRGIYLGGDVRADEGAEPLISVAEMMDELPLLALVAVGANGRTIVRGAAELRLKESDRIASTVGLLRALGATIDEFDDGFELVGPQRLVGGVDVDHVGDHRLCMTAGVAALIADRPLRIDDPSVVAVSYPRFWADLASIGAGGEAVLQ
jgi:3-phosphoshikimate 1-carboxyvinyltransferase